MEVKEIKSEGLSREFSVVLPASEIEAKISSRLKEVAQTAQIPGFRPGKVPVTLLRKRYGPSIMGEILDRAIGDSSQQAIAEKGVRPASQPEIEITSFEDGKDLEYSVKLEVIPEIKPVDFSQITLERLIPKVKEEDVLKTLDHIANAQKTSSSLKKKRKSKSGDILIIDFVGKVQDKEFPGGKAEDYKLELGSNSFIPGFEDQLISKNSGDKVEVKVTFPEEYGAEELAGKDAVFSVKIKDIQSPVPAKIDDELAKKVGLENLENLKQKIEEEQSKEFRQLSRLRMKRKLLDVLSDYCDFEAPPKMVEAEFNSIWKQFEEQEKSKKPESSSKTPKKVNKSKQEKEFKEIATRRVSLGLLMSEIGKENNIQVSQDDINQAINTEAQKYPGEEQKIIEYYRGNPEAAQQISAPIYEEKVVDFIFEMANINEKEVTNDEFVKLLEKESKEEELDKKPAKSKNKSTRSDKKTKNTTLQNQKDNKT